MSNAAFDAAHTFLDADLVMKFAEPAVVMRASNALLSAALVTTSRNQSLSGESEFFLHVHVLFLVDNHDAKCYQTVAVRATTHHE